MFETRKRQVSALLAEAALIAEDTMPHMNGVQTADSDMSSDGSICSSNLGAEGDVAVSATNRLLSLAAVAEVHAKSSADSAEAKEGSTTVEAPTSCSPTVVPSTTQQLQHPEEGPEVPMVVPGMGHRWGPVGHPPRYPRYFPQPPMRLIFPPDHSSAGSPIPAEHSPGRFIRRGPPPPPRGGFPMWAGPPPPPYHPHSYGVVVGPASLSPHFRRPFPPPFMTHQYSKSEDIQQEPGVHAKRPSPGYPPKSILKKPRTDAYPATVSPETSEDITNEVSAEALAQATLETLAASATAIIEASRQPRLDATGKKQSAKLAAVVERSSSEEEEMAQIKPKQRIISPASSNEYPKADYEDDLSLSVEDNLSPDQQRRMMYSEAIAGSPHRLYNSPKAPPFRMGRIHPPMPPTMRTGPHPYMVFPHPGMRPFHIGMHAPSMYPPPPNLSTRGRGPGFAAVQSLYARANIESTPSPYSFSPEQKKEKHSDQPLPSTAESIPNVTTSASQCSQAGGMETPTKTDETACGKRCIPLTPPVPSRYWT
jgi:hypothetical protein